LAVTRKNLLVYKRSEFGAKKKDQVIFFAAFFYLIAKRRTPNAELLIKLSSFDPLAFDQGPELVGQAFQDIDIWEPAITLLTP
jgi:hypothetical protein